MSQSPNARSRSTIIVIGVVAIPLVFCILPGIASGIVGLFTATAHMAAGVTMRADQRQEIDHGYRGSGLTMPSGLPPLAGAATVPMVTLNQIWEVTTVAAESEFEVGQRCEMRLSYDPRRVTDYGNEYFDCDVTVDCGDLRALPPSDLMAGARPTASCSSDPSNPPMVYVSNYQDPSHYASIDFGAELSLQSHSETEESYTIRYVSVAGEAASELPEPPTEAEVEVEAGEPNAGSEAP